MKDVSYTPLASSEIGILWMTYQEKTMTLQMLRYFLYHAQGEEAKALLTRSLAEVNGFLDRIRDIHRKEGVVTPSASGKMT